MVKKEYAIEVLQECADFDPDPVPADLQDAVFTMPLPLRLLRYWADHATHPNIKNFQLSEAEMERERTLHAKLVEEAEKLNLESQPKVQKKGLTSVVNDMRGIAKSVTASSAGSEFMSGMAKFMNEHCAPAEDPIGRDSEDQADRALHAQSKPPDGGSDQSELNTDAQISGKSIPHNETPRVKKG